MTASASRSGTPEGERTLEGSHVLRAAGRAPNTERLDLPAAGIATDAQGVHHGESTLETSVPGVYALGDVKGGPAFTHISYDDYQSHPHQPVTGRRACITDRLVPYAVFIDPQLGRIGLSEKDARRQGRAYPGGEDPDDPRGAGARAGRIARLHEGPGGPGTGSILGAAVLGIEGGELMAVLQLAMMGKLPYTRLRDAVFAHPTLAESLNTLFTTLET